MREELFPEKEWNSKEAFKFIGLHRFPHTKYIEVNNPSEIKDILNDDSSTIEVQNPILYNLCFFSQKDVEGNTYTYCRIFSEDINPRTGFNYEITDTVPWLRDIEFPEEIESTVIKGYFNIDINPETKTSYGVNKFYAVDVIKYHGIDVSRTEPLKRKKFLIELVNEVNSECIMVNPFDKAGKECSSLDRLTDGGKTMIFNSPSSAYQCCWNCNIDPHDVIDYGGNPTLVYELKHNLNISSVGLCELMIIRGLDIVIRNSREFYLIRSKVNL